MAKQVTISGLVSLPQEEGGQPAPYNLAQTFTYTKKAEFDQAYDGVVTNDPISLGTMSVSGAKLLLVKASIGGCTFRVNGAVLDIPIPVGAFMLYSNPSAGFITSLSVSVTGAASISILALA